jgi:hypothetical protein
MLENSIWYRYHPEKTVRETLAALYGCDASQIAADEGTLYAELKRTLTKKELRLFIMNETDCSETEMAEAVGLTAEECAKGLKRAYHKIRNKVRPHIKTGADTPAAGEEA